MEFIKSFNPTTNFKNSHHRQKGWAKTISIVGQNTDGELQAFAEVRIYETPSRTYACVWLFFGGRPCASAMVDGGGYAQEPFAISDALEKLGVEFTQDMRGRGTWDLSDALAELCVEYAKDCVKAKAFIYHP